jgi:pimeloyl-ACP methyl ester carboxylesterase
VTDLLLVPGAGCDAGYWQPLVDELTTRGHRAVPVDLPCDDDAAGLGDYAQLIVDAARDLVDPVIVTHSFGGFSGALAASRLPTSRLVFASAMIPAPGEKGAEWFEHTGWQPGSDDFGALFYSDIEPREKASVFERRQSDTPGSEPWPLPRLPDVPTRAIVFADDRFFPADFMRGVVRARLGVEPATVPGGHLAMVSRPAELAEELLS